MPGSQAELRHGKERNCLTPLLQTTGSTPNSSLFKSLWPITGFYPQNQVPWGKGEQIKRGIQGTRPKADSASELKRPTSRTIWASVPLGFSKVVQGQVGTVTHIYLNQKTSQETQDQNTRGPDSTTSE